MCEVSCVGMYSYHCSNVLESAISIYPVHKICWVFICLVLSVSHPLLVKGFLSCDLDFPKSLQYLISFRACQIRQRVSVNWCALSALHLSLPHSLCTYIRKYHCLSLSVAAFSFSVLVSSCTYVLLGLSGEGG